jgi:NMD protein affecting ribosome stability and mRNA decay
VRHLIDALPSGQMKRNLEARARRLHEHKAVVAHALRQHAGIPYEVEQQVCSDCRRVLGERTVRRAVA